jgi:hypothetical protein
VLLLFFIERGIIMIDISSKITNQLPMVKITETIVVTVNNRKSNVLSMQGYFKNKENAKKTENEIKSDILEILIPPKDVAAIEELDLPLPEFNEIYETIVAVATGRYGKEDTPSK